MNFNAGDTQVFGPTSSVRCQLPKPHTSGVRVDVAGLSHPGNLRPNNEDHFLVARIGRFLESLATNLPADQVPSRFEEDGYGMAVADGMGGHAAGEEASRLAITTLLNEVLSAPDWILRGDDPSLAAEIMRRAADRFEKIAHVLAQEAADDSQLHGFGTTMTFAASVGRNLFIAHIGDSRAYVLRRGTLHQLTRDHTLVREMYEAGEITLDQAATHRMRHALTRNLGPHRGARPDVQELGLEDGDCLLLSSDGLHEMVSDEVIAAVLAESVNSQTMCGRLVELALAAGGKDNVTVIVAQYSISEGDGS
jgi:serine/threonine protein phosphatase PrpC